jgi:hypothetical protein
MQNTAGPSVDPAMGKTYVLNVTQVELAHIRDLMSILMPPTGARSLSQELAISESRPYVDSLLFKKVYKLCAEAGVPTGPEAPDFGLSLGEVPTVVVTRVMTQLIDEPGACEAA